MDSNFVRACLPVNETVWVYQCSNYLDTFHSFLSVDNNNIQINVSISASGPCQNKIQSSIFNLQPSAIGFSIFLNNYRNISEDISILLSYSDNGCGLNCSMFIQLHLEKNIYHNHLLRPLERFQYTLYAPFFFVFFFRHVFRTSLSFVVERYFIETPPLSPPPS